LQSESCEHFQFIHQVELISVEEFAEKIISQAVANPGITDVFDRLLTATKDTNEIYIVRVPSIWCGKTFNDIYQWLVESEEEICLLGYETITEKSGKRTIVLNPCTNPTSNHGVVNWRNYKVKDGDALIVMAYEEPSW
jgi:hypothetical protein